MDQDANQWNLDSESVVYTIKDCVSKPTRAFGLLDFQFESMALIDLT